MFFVLYLDLISGLCRAIFPVYLVSFHNQEYKWKSELTMLQLLQLVSSLKYNKLMVTKTYLVEL